MGSIRRFFGGTVLLGAVLAASMCRAQSLPGSALPGSALPGSALPGGALPGGLTPGGIDALAERARQTFGVPGLAIALVQDGKVVFARGYGRRAENPKSLPVDRRTLFAIGSNTKEFTAAALATLVDDGRLSWDDRVIDHMPAFRVADPWITREFRVSDLLTHHSGMGLGAGDLMLFSHSTFTRKEVLAGLPFMSFTGPFRVQYAYNNLLYVTAGALVEQITGRSWEDYVQHRLIDAAGLPACQATPPDSGEHDVARGEGAGETLPDKAHAISPAVAPAGGIWCSVDGVARWAQVYLAGGVTPEGKRIFSTAQRDELWAPHALVPLADTAAATRSHFRAYGYGWFMEDFFGRKRVWHTGTISGMVSYVSFLPELKSAVVVLTNHDDYAVTYALATTLGSMIAAGRSEDWIAHWKKEEDEKDAKRRKEAETSGPGSPARPFVALSAAGRGDFVGTYRDAWRGDLHVAAQGADLRLSFDRAPGLSGKLFALPHDLFVVRWDEREEDGGDDCYVQFLRGVDGKVTGMRMRVIGSDFSFDAQDLHPEKIADHP